MVVGFAVSYVTRGSILRLLPWSQVKSMGNSPYLPVLVLFAGGAGFAIAPLVLAWVWAKKFSPQKTGPSKNATYECGLESKGDAWIQFKPGYYLYAIVFLIFDVEAIFLLPFAAAFPGLGMAEAIAMLVFLLLLVEGLVWACQKNVLSWS
jgi:NADH:ubiquinone oxidoreductase subunit 3 (subunit A)